MVVRYSTTCSPWGEPRDRAGMATADDAPGANRTMVMRTRHSSRWNLISVWRVRRGDYIVANTDRRYGFGPARPTAWRYVVRCGTYRRVALSLTARRGGRAVRPRRRPGHATSGRACRGYWRHGSRR